jgi:hypothetical protein
MALLRKFSNEVIPCDKFYPDKHTFIEALLQKYNVPTTYYQKQWRFVSAVKAMVPLS